MWFIPCKDFNFLFGNRGVKSTINVPTIAFKNTKPCAHWGCGDIQAVLPWRGPHLCLKPYCSRGLCWCLWSKSPPTAMRMSVACVAAWNTWMSMSRVVVRCHTDLSGCAAAWGHGNVWVHGPTTAGDCVYGQGCCHQKPSGGPWLWRARRCISGRRWAFQGGGSKWQIGGLPRPDCPCNPQQGGWL